MLRALGSSIVHVHMSDHGEYGDCLLLGRGYFRWEAFLAELQTYNPECSVVLELYRSGFNHVTELVSNYSILKNRLDALGKGGV